MFHLHQSFDADFAAFAQSVNPVVNPNLNLIFPQPVLPSEPDLNPPPADPCGSLASDPSNSGGFDGPTSNCNDPSRSSQSWAVEQADQIMNVTAISSVNEKSLASTSLNSLGDSSVMNQPLVNNVTKMVPKKTKILESIWCEVCGVNCNNKDIYEKHISGKKHRKNLQMPSNPTTTVHGTANAAAGEGLEAKRQKLIEGSATVTFLRSCTLCNVLCNSQEMYDKHLSGKKHTAQARKNLPDAMEISVGASQNPVLGISPPGGSCETDSSKSNVAWCEVCNIFCTSNDILIMHKAGRKHLKNIGLAANPNETNVAQLTQCEVCNISCSCEANLIIHRVGKKHLKNLEKLKKSEKITHSLALGNAPVPMNLVHVPIETTSTESQALKDDLETKKRKVMDCGAAVDAVKICTICNVVCNSQAVFDSHLAGQKHASMVRKQAAAARRSMVGGSQFLQPPKGG